MDAPDIIAEHIVTTLSGGLAGELTSMEASYADSIELGTPAYWRAVQENYPGDLNLVVVMDQADPLNDDNRHRYTGRVEVIVAGQQGHATYSAAETVNKRAWRAARGVQALLHNKTLSDNVDRVFVEEMLFSSSLDGDEAQEQRIDVALVAHTCQ